MDTTQQTRSQHITVISWSTCCMISSALRTMKVPSLLRRTQSDRLCALPGWKLGASTWASWTNLSPVERSFWLATASQLLISGLVSSILTCSLTTCTHSRRKEQCSWVCIQTSRTMVRDSRLKWDHTSTRERQSQHDLPYQQEDPAKQGIDCTTAPRFEFLLKSIINLEIQIMLKSKNASF